MRNCLVQIHDKVADVAVSHIHLQTGNRQQSDISSAWQYPLEKTNTDFSTCAAQTLPPAVHLTRHCSFYCNSAIKQPRARERGSQGPGGLTCALMLTSRSLMIALTFLSTPGTFWWIFKMRWDLPSCGKSSCNSTTEKEIRYRKGLLMPEFGGCQQTWQISTGEWVLILGCKTRLQEAYAPQ